MKIVDAYWANPVNIIGVYCEECDIKFAWPSNISLATCPLCSNSQLWHDVAPKGGIWSHTTMEQMDAIRQ